MHNSKDTDFWERSIDGLSELYQLLGEEDLAYGLWQRRSSLDLTKTALHLEQHGMWQKAQVHLHPTYMTVEQYLLMCNIFEGPLL